MNAKHDNLRDTIGQAISDAIGSDGGEIDCYDSKEIDRIADAVIAVLPAPSAEPNYVEIVNRFLSWKLPKDFAPDAGISFKPTKPYEGDERGNSWWPIGTNLLTAEQAKEMFKYCMQPPNTES